jgi:hypothetical protein
MLVGCRAARELRRSIRWTWRRSIHPGAAAVARFVNSRRPARGGLVSSAVVENAYLSPMLVT